LAEFSEVTLGEVARGLNRVEREMHEGFAAIRREIGHLSFVPAAVYSADMVAYRERMERVEAGLAEEISLRREDAQTSSQRAWQSRWGIALALIAMPISIVGAVIAALIVASVTVK
jgi:hypothetical protein